MRPVRAGLLVLALALSAIGTARGQEAPQDAPEDINIGPPSTRDTREPEPSREAFELLRRDLGSLPGVVDPAVYRLGPGDVLQLNLGGGVSRSVLVEVGPEGTVLIPGVGSLKVDGMLLQQARTEILNRMRGSFRGVNMDVRLARPRRFRIYLAGQVKAPGPVDATGGSRVGDVLVPTALGAKASQRNIVVNHKDGTSEIADLQLFLTNADPTLNPPLRDGDVLEVPTATQFVRIHGAVARPGSFELGPRDSLLTLLRLAGGALPASDSTRALFVRWTDASQVESTWVELGAVRERTVNPSLRNGDALYVFFIPRYQEHQEVTITGEVYRPGIYPIREGRERVTDLVRGAGGFLPTANLAGIRVVRTNPEAGANDPELQRLLRLGRQELTETEYEVLRTKLAALKEEYRIDWNRLQSEGPPLDILLRTGDRIVVDPLLSTIRVDGEVRRPGFVAYRSGLPVEEYVRNAGGYSNRAWRSKVRVTRSVTGQTLLARDVQKLDPGDLVWVPEKPDKTIWDHGLVLLAATAQVATVLIAIRSINRGQ